MMPGETHSKVAGLASEAASSCQNCTVLQQNLNEYVAALITLKQKIIDSDHLLADYQQKCNDLQCVKRDNETLRCQLENILQRVSLKEQNDKEQLSLGTELEVMKTALKAFQQTQWECVKVKEECEKDVAKKNLEEKIKKMEDAAKKHVNDIKQLQLEKKVIGKKLRKMQKKLGVFQNVKCKKVKNVKIQVANEQPLVKLNKKKIKVLLEELWGCIESSTEHDDQLILETTFESSNLKNSFDYTSSLAHGSPSVVYHKFNTSAESTFVYESDEPSLCMKDKKKHTNDMTIGDCVGVGLVCEETHQIVLEGLNDNCPLTFDHENDVEELVQILNWAKPLPHLLSPLKVSPLTTKHVFGEFTDSSDDDLSETTGTNGTIDCKPPINKIVCVQDSSTFLQVTGIENVIENCKRGDEIGGNMKAATVANSIKSHCKSDVSVATKIGFDGNHKTETLLPSTELSSIQQPKDDLTLPVSNEMSNNETYNSIDMPMDAESTSTMEINDIQCSEKDLSSSRACNLPLFCNPSVNYNTTLSKDLFLHNVYPNEMMKNECHITGSLQVDGISSAGDIYVNIKNNLKDSKISVTYDNQDIKQFPDSSESNDEFNMLPTPMDCPMSNCLENLQYRKYGTTSVNTEMQFINDKVPEQSAPVAELKHEDAQISVQCNVAIKDNNIPVFIKDQSVQKSSMLPQQNVSLKMIEGIGQCSKEIPNSAVDNKAECLSALAENSFYTDDHQPKMTQNKLDLVDVCAEKQNQPASEIQTQKVQEPKRKASETDNMCNYVNQSGRIKLSKPFESLLSCPSSSETHYLSNEIHSENEVVNNLSLCSPKDVKVDSSVLLHSKVNIADEFKATNAGNMALQSNHQFTQEVEDLYVDSNDKNTCKRASPPLETNTFSVITDKSNDNEDMSSVSLDSEEDDFSLVRKVSNTRVVSNPVNLKKSFKSPSKAIDEKICKVDFGLKGTPCNCESDLPSCVGSKNKSNSSENETGIFMEQDSVNEIVDAENTVIYHSNNKKKESTLSIECKKQDDTHTVQTLCISSNSGINLNTFDTDQVKALPGKNLQWNSGKCNLFDKVKHVKKDNQQNTLQTSQVQQTVLENADTSSSCKCSPETINKVRSEMGPPLPPLLDPLLSTPPKMMRPLSPSMSSSRSSLPSPVDNLISPLPGIPFLPMLSPLSEGCKQTMSLTTVSPVEKANQRNVSSPLQFCAATPKHALPVPGRLPLSASGSSTTSVQENSVKILDTIYPELSARARTLNILKGHVQLNKGLPCNCKNLHVSQITGFKPITSTTTAFIKTVSDSSSDNSKVKLSSCENQKPPSNKRTTEFFLMPKSAKRLRLDSESPVMDPVKDQSPILGKDMEVRKPNESWHIGYCELLPDVVKGSSVDEDVITNALKKIEDLCFDLLPVIKSHIFVGTIPRVPVMRNEEKEVIYEFSNSKKSLADRFLHVILKKIRAGKVLLQSVCLQALCRVYVGLCRQLGDIERARILCYSVLKEDFPDPDRLFLFIVSSWNDILSTHGVVSKAMQAIMKTVAKEEVSYCLSAYLSWENACTSSMNVNVLLSSVLMAIQLYPDVKFQQSEKYGEDLTDSVWEYVFAVDLLCSHRKWVWTHDNVISKELWPLLDKWVKRKKGNPNITFVPDIIVAAVLRLVGRLCYMGIKEGFVSAVKNIGTVIIKFLQHANEEGMPWGMQLSCVYMLCELAPSDPAAIFKTLQEWKDASRNGIPPAIESCIQEAESICKLNK